MASRPLDDLPDGAQLGLPRGGAGPRRDTDDLQR